MIARLLKFYDEISENFWLLPAVIVLAAALAALGLVQLDRVGAVPEWLLKNWLYDGGATGARTLLGAIASSTIGVAGTVFTITIAALSLAAGQMGPRLLRNFTKDRSNQLTLGIFLGTFSFALLVLRSVRTQDEGAFIPHLGLTTAILLAFVCVAMLVYFVGHMAGRINVDTVIELVSEELQAAIARLTVDDPQPEPPPLQFWKQATAITDDRRGYLQHVDEEGLADWADCHMVAIRMLVGPGGYVFPGAAVAVVMGPAQGADAAIRNATALAPRRVPSADLEFVVKQLVEVAVRALSPGINDPHTAMGALDRLGAALCDLVPLHLPTGVLLRDNRPVLVVPVLQYDGLLDAMFQMIRQSAMGNAAVLRHMLEVLTVVVGTERDRDRKMSLRRQADLIQNDARRSVSSPEDLRAIALRHIAFVTMFERGPLGCFQARR